VCSTVWALLDVCFARDTSQGGLRGVRAPQVRPDASRHGPTARERERLLKAAFDTGARHFDVVRSYGRGAADAKLGRSARGKRNRPVIATNFGIEVSARASPEISLRELGTDRVDRLLVHTSPGSHATPSRAASSAGERARAVPALLARIDEEAVAPSMPGMMAEAGERER